MKNTTLFLANPLITRVQHNITALFDAFRRPPFLQVLAKDTIQPDRSGLLGVSCIDSKYYLRPTVVLSMLFATWSFTGHRCWSQLYQHVHFNNFVSFVDQVWNIIRIRKFWKVIQFVSGWPHWLRLQNVPLRSVKNPTDTAENTCSEFCLVCVYSRGFHAPMTLPGAFSSMDVRYPFTYDGYRVPF